MTFDRTTKGIFSKSDIDTRTPMEWLSTFVSYYIAILMELSAICIWFKG